MMRAALALCSVLCLLDAPALAITQVTNLSESLDVEFTADGTHFAQASSFTTGPNPTQLQSVTVSVFTNTSGSSELRLRADAGGQPGALIASLGTQNLPSNQGEVLLVYAAAGTPLAANTTYWVTLGETGSGSFDWGGTISTNQSSPNGWTIGDQAMDQTAGSSVWIPVNFGPPNESGLFAVDAAPQASSDWAVIGNPGNACDPQSQGCFGAVSYPYLISKYEVTNAQFAEFLSAIAASDPNGIYNSEMRITRSGSPGSFSYVASTGAENQPLTALSFYDALRFVNWLHHGKPVGAQDASTTEDGAYTFSGPTTVGARNVGALYALPSEDEWYKAAYYDPSSASYFDWPTSSNALPTCSFPTAAPNHANCETAVGDFTNVGSYPGSPSPYGTFDQGGNAYEWNETLIGSERGIRGGSWHPSLPKTVMNAASRFSADPATEGFDDSLVGFRVVPEPDAAVQLASGIAALLALARRHRQRARKVQAGGIGKSSS